MKTQQQARPALGYWVLIVCVTVAAYLPALRGGLVWDDTSHITRLDLQSWQGLWQIWFRLGATQQYYPLLHSAFWAEHRLWGDAVLGYHLTNVLLHAASAWLVVLIVRRLALPGDWLAGLLFAVHPVAVEAVAWISEQKSTLSGFFYLAAALAYLQFDGSRRWSRYAAALALFLAALLTKSVTATLPAALLVVLWWRRGRLEWKRDVLPLAPWLAVGAASGLFTAWVERTYIGAQGAEFGLSAVQRILLAGRVVWFYFGKLMLPVDLTFFYPRWQVDAGVWWQWLFPCGLLAAAVALRRNRGAMAALLLFGGSLFPVLGFFNIYPFRYSFVADHFQYLAMLAVLIPAAALVGRRHFAIGGTLVAILAALTFAQNGSYRDSDTLYRQTITRNPDAWLAHNNLGNSLLEKGQRDEAIGEFETALRIQPDFSEAHLSLANALAQIPERLPDAIAEYQAAIRTQPNSERAHNNLGDLLRRTGRLDEAGAELRTALRLKPDYAEAHNNMGNLLSMLPGRLPEAEAEYRTALEYDARLPEAHNNLGRCLAQSGHLADAIPQFEEAIRLRPAYAGAHINLGNALSSMPGRLPDAVAEYQAAIRDEPNSAAAHFNLGNALAQLPGRRMDAIAEYESVMRLQPNERTQRLIEQLKLGQ